MVIVWFMLQNHLSHSFIGELDIPYLFLTMAFDAESSNLMSFFVDFCVKHFGSYFSIRDYFHLFVIHQANKGFLVLHKGEKVSILRFFLVFHSDSSL